jgi:hypothetical protein
MSSLGEFSAEITGSFTSGDVYYFRAVGYPVGLGDEKTFMVPTGISILTLDATDVSVNGVTLNGNLSDIGGRSALDVYFEWGEEPGSYTQTTTMLSMSSSGPFSEVVPGPFAIGETYYFRARSGEGGTGEEMSFFIPGDVEVTTLNATMISTLFATLNGELVNMGGASSVDVYFVWGESPGNYPNESEKETLTGPGAFSIEIEGDLMPGNTYYFRARTDPAGEGKEVSFHVY